MIHSHIRCNHPHAPNPVSFSSSASPMRASPILHVIRLPASHHSNPTQSFLHQSSDRCLSFVTLSSSSDQSLSSSTPQFATSSAYASIPAPATSLPNQWEIRDFDAGCDFNRIVAMQTEAFHQSTSPNSPLHIPFLDSFSYGIFRAEVLDSLRSKMKQAKVDPNFSMLVATAPPVDDQATAPDQDPSSSITITNRAKRKTSVSLSQAVGIVELSLASREVIDSLKSSKVITSFEPSAAYISSMAVSVQHRRRGVATALIKACERVAVQWGERKLSLFVYQDNKEALRLYEGLGFRVVWRDPNWKGWVPGARIRLLMVKEVSTID